METDSEESKKVTGEDDAEQDDSMDEPESD